MRGPLQLASLLATRIDRGVKGGRKKGGEDWQEKRKGAKIFIFFNFYCGEGGGGGKRKGKRFKEGTRRKGALSLFNICFPEGGEKKKRKSRERKRREIRLLLFRSPG